MPNLKEEVEGTDLRKAATINRFDQTHFDVTFHEKLNVTLVLASLMMNDLLLFFVTYHSKLTGSRLFCPLRLYQ